MTKKGKLQLIIFMSIVVIATLTLYRITAVQTHEHPASTQPIELPHINIQTTTPQDDVWMTVFVHGSITHLVRKFNIETIRSIFRDETDGTLYEKATEHMRHNQFFRRDQAMQDLGLQKIDKTTIMPGKASTALANIFDQIDMWNAGRTPESNLYYTFGWDALVSEKIRHKNAEKFYAELFEEIQRLKALGLNPKIRIYGFSHGGTVSLTLANIHYIKPVDKQIFIDELVLLGTPLHIKMYDQICSPLFKKIYNFYSPKDRAQRLDLTTPGFLSQHIFIAPKDKKLPDKLTQIQLSITRNRTTKRKINPTQDQRYNFDQPSILHGSSDLFRRSSPGHTELWFFQWAVFGYRDNFSLRPLPTVATVPIILDAIKKHTELGQTRYNVDLRPDQELFLVKTPTNHVVVPLLTHNQFNELKTMARAYEVKQHPSLEYNDQARMAVMWAQQERKLLKINTAS